MTQHYDGTISDTNKEKVKWNEAPGYGPDITRCGSWHEVLEFVEAVS